MTPEKPAARIRFCHYAFDPAWGFRAALARYYELFPDAFRCRTPQQGLWMPFARISKVEGWEDFGFKFKEGNDETAWDDAHGIITFRYTEPMTWWMTMPTEMPRTIEAAVAEARRRADQKRDRQAQALLTSGYHDAEGQFPARLLDTPWCNGAVWSMNSMPGIAGEVTDFKQQVERRNCASSCTARARKGDLDGEYIDSSEGYVTDELDFRRDHFAAADTPLTFAPETLPAGHLPRPGRLRVRPRDRPRRTRDGQADDGQRRAGPAVLAAAAAGSAGHRDRLESAAASGGRCRTRNCSTAGRCAKASRSAS